MGKVVSQVVDDTRVLCEASFPPGKQFGPAPVSSDCGEVKGFELLFFRGQDGFVPSDENWVSFLLDRAAGRLGKPVARSVSR